MADRLTTFLVWDSIGKFHIGGNTWLAWLMTRWHGWLPVLPTTPCLRQPWLAWLVTPAASHANWSSTMPTTYCHQNGTFRCHKELYSYLQTCNQRPSFNLAGSRLF